MGRALGTILGKGKARRGRVVGARRAVGGGAGVCGDDRRDQEEGVAREGGSGSGENRKWEQGGQERGAGSLNVGKGE